MLDKNPAYPAAVEALKADGVIPNRVVLRQCKHLNNVIEQDHRMVKKRVWLAKVYGAFQGASRTLQGIETVNMIRKGRSENGWPKAMHSATRTSLATCSDSLSDQHSRSTDLSGPESILPKLPNETLLPAKASRKAQLKPSAEVGGHTGGAIMSRQ
jgi:hypothetical protein